MITREKRGFFDISISTKQNNRSIGLLSTLLSLRPPPQKEHRQTSQLAGLAHPARAAVSLAAGDEFGLVTIGVPPIREGSVVILGPLGPDRTVPTTAA
jgi:hypothetical protein